ncbi:MAG: BrnA antitoxin family protein [Pseudorhizobium sp.]
MVGKTGCRARAARRPKSPQTKVSTTIRLDADVLEQFRAQGPGWQSRINQALRDWLSRN